MNKFLFSLIAGLTAVVFAAGSFLIYLQHQNLELYTKQLLGVKQNYLKLETEYDRLEEKTKNLNQIVVLAKGDDEKAKQIGTSITDFAKQVDGNISVYYKNLTTDESVTLNSDQKYYMASLYKVILVLYLLEKIDDGTAALTDRVGTSSATLDIAIDKIISESNNEYAQTLATQYGWKQIEQTMKKKLGIDFSFDSDLQISIRNVGKLFEEIAYSISVSDTDSHYILNLMNNQQKTNKLPKYLPKNIYAHNKTGEFENYSHDAGIFYTPKANYILIFMSKSKNPGTTDELMAKMSKEIYDVLNAP